MKNANVLSRTIYLLFTLFVNAHHLKHQNALNVKDVSDIRNPP